MSENGYNGWTNYETWCVKVWMDNDEGTHNYWLERAGEIAESDEDNKRITLADELKDSYAEDMPELSASVWSDLLSSAMQSVDWREIAVSLLEDQCERNDETPPWAE